MNISTRLGSHISDIICDIYLNNALVVASKTDELLLLHSNILACKLCFICCRGFAEDNVHSLKKLKLCEFSYTNLLSSTKPNPLFSFKTTVIADEGLNFYTFFFSSKNSLLNLKI